MSPDTAAGEWREAGGAAAPEPPAKAVLFRPAASHLLAVLATACEALPPVSALLIYLSASGARRAGPGGARAQEALGGAAAACEACLVR